MRKAFIIRFGVNITVYRKSGKPSECLVEATSQEAASDQDILLNVAKLLIAVEKNFDEVAEYLGLENPDAVSADFEKKYGAMPDAFQAAARKVLPVLDIDDVLMEMVWMGSIVLPEADSSMMPVWKKLKFDSWRQNSMRSEFKDEYDLALNELREKYFPTEAKIQEVLGELENTGPV